MKPGFLLLAISIIALQLIPNVSSSQALAFGWNGSIDTDLDFSEFFNGNFTINIRYLQQYPHAYYGPMVAENGDGNFIIGQGDYFGNGSEGDKLYIQIGNKTFSAKTGGDNTHWKDLVLVAQRTGTDINCKVYLNGNSIGSLSVPANDPNLPKGKIRFGKRTDAKLVNNATGQFYGLLDDIGFYNKAYSEQEVQALLNHPFQLTGTEPNVVAAYTFDNSVAVPAFKRKITRNGFIKSVAVSANRNGLTDLAAIPLPDYHTQMILPFPPGEAWLVIQGQDDASGSHKGMLRFAGIL